MYDNEPSFEDYYETLQLNPNADQETISRVFRLLAKRYHPDNLETGDPERFSRLRRAYEILSHPSSRAKYDARYFSERSAQWKVFSRNENDRESDTRIFQAILSLLYVARRQNARKPGVGPIQLENMLGCPPEYLDFHLWYLREKLWIERTENGQWAITALGVEKVCEGDFALRADRLLKEQNHYSPSESEGAGNGGSTTLIHGEK